VAALALAAALLPASPAVAQTVTPTPTATPSPAPTPTSQPTTLSASARTLLYGQTVDIRVQAQPGSTVDLYAYTQPNSTYRVIRTATVGPDSPSLTFVGLRPGGTTRFTAQVRGGSRSSEVTVAVQRTVTLGVRQTSPGTYTFTGVVERQVEGLPVTLAKVLADGRVVGVGSTVTGSGGSYGISARLSPGTNLYYALTAPTADLLAGRSRAYGLAVPGAAPARPAAVSPQHGGSYVAVYLAVARSASDARLSAATASARRLGYAAAVTTLGCDSGAAAGLGLPAGSQDAAVVLYFRSVDEARAFAALHPPAEAGVVRVRTFCLD
jgi:hypothetical protein